MKQYSELSLLDILAAKELAGSQAYAAHFKPKANSSNMCFEEEHALVIIRPSHTGFVYVIISDSCKDEVGGSPRFCGTGISWESAYTNAQIRYTNLVKSGKMFTSKARMKRIERQAAITLAHSALLNRLHRDELAQSEVEDEDE